jgi:hypothetical protein
VIFGSIQSPELLAIVETKSSSLKA